MYAIAEGAAIVAAGLTEKVCTVSRDYYIKLATGLEKIISRGDALPYSSMQTFRTVVEDQRLINFAFFNRDESNKLDEAVGEMWLSLPKCYPAGTAITVTLELDEQTSSLQFSAFLREDPSVRVSSSFSRGRADERIYRQIAEIIADSNEQNLDQAEMQELNRQIAPIVDTANQTIDPLTGKERPDLFQRAEEAITKLKRDSTTERRRADNWANYCNYLINIYGFLTPQVQIDRLRELSNKLRDAMRRDDFSQMESTCEAAMRENQMMPEWVRRMRYIELAIYNARQLKPAKAQAMDLQHDKLMIALRENDMETAEQLWYTQQIEANQWIDEEAPAATINTGLQR
jgi:molecular chaperone DnaK